jgi:hypothetical protein
MNTPDNLIDLLDNLIDLRDRVDVLYYRSQEQSAYNTHLTAQGQAAAIEWADSFVHTMNAPFDPNHFSRAMDAVEGNALVREIPVFLRGCMAKVLEHDRILKDRDTPQVELQKLKTQISDIIVDVELFKRSVELDVEAFKHELKASLLAEARASFGLNKANIQKVASIKRKTV